MSNNVKSLPSIEVLNFLFEYNSSTGILSRRVSTSANALKDTEAGTITQSGYRAVYIRDENGEKRKYFVHRIIYKMMTGEEPLLSIDHIDGNSLNNRFDNLRLASPAVNNRNQKMHSHNTSGFTGVSWCKQSDKWQAHIKVKNKLYGLGQFATIEEAIAARRGAIKAMNVLLEKDGYTKSHGIRVAQQ